VRVIVLCFARVAYTAYRGWRAGFTLAHGAIVVLCLLLATLLLWVGRRHFIVFREQPDMPIGEAPDLRVEEKLQLRGSGLFQVSDMSRYLVEVPVIFWTTQLAEHIVAARVRALNILGVGVPSAEHGWWYYFIEPKQVTEVIPGYLCFGLGIRPALRVQHLAQKGHQLMYISCDDAEQRDLVWKELGTRAQAAHQGRT